jgi:hypothetical protein
MMVRRDKDGVTHWAHPPTPMMYHQKISATGAQCDQQITVLGDLQSVPQDGPTCLWCIRGIKR